MSNFWQKLPKPILALAPMAGVTDSAFRQICKQYGADVVYSEMASATALAYQSTKTISLLLSQKSEAPYVIQLFGSQPKHFAQAVRLLTDRQAIKRLGFKNYNLPQGFDINLGCPVPKVRKQTAGCALFADLPLARQVVKATIEQTDLPVSIKIRSRVGAIDCCQFLDSVADLDIKAVMIHGRSLTQGFSGEIDYEIINQARQYFKGIILANGGVNNPEQARLMLGKTQADGLGIARGVWGRPWLFQEIKESRIIFKDKNEIISIIWRQAELANKYSLLAGANFQEIRKHLGWYVKNWPQAKAMRQELMRVKILDDIKRILAKYL